MLAATPAPVVEDNDSRTCLQVITAVGPQIGAFSFPAAGVELGHGRLIDMERAAFLIEDTNQRIGCLLNPESLVMRRVAGLRRARDTVVRFDENVPLTQEV